MSALIRSAAALAAALACTTSLHAQAPPNDDCSAFRSSSILRPRRYIADFGAKEFRCVGDGFQGIDFCSAQGRRFWDELMILTCRGCGLTTVEPRHIEIPDSSLPY